MRTRLSDNLLIGRGSAAGSVALEQAAVVTFVKGPGIPTEPDCPSGRALEPRSRTSWNWATRPISVLDPQQKALFDAYLATRLPK
jgi:hypothetical protein